MNIRWKELVIGTDLFKIRPVDQFHPESRYNKRILESKNSEETFRQLKLNWICVIKVRIECKTASRGHNRFWGDARGLVVAYYLKIRRIRDHMTKKDQTVIFKDQRGTISLSWLTFSCRELLGEAQSNYQQTRYEHTKTVKCKLSNKTKFNMNIMVAKSKQ